MELTKENYEKELNGQDHRCGSYLRAAFPIAFDIKYREWVAKQEKIKSEYDECEKILEEGNREFEKLYEKGDDNEQRSAEGFDRR